MKCARQIWKQEMSDVIFDLEATCWNNGPKRQMETIEIGAVKVVDDVIVDEFDVFIKPMLFTQLSKFCRTLTSITQENVDNGLGFPEAIASFEKWCGDARLWSWGEFDRRQLEKDGGLYGIDMSFLEGHRDLSKSFKDRYRLGKRRCTTGKALAICGYDFEGTQHRGIDDARNIAHIFLKDAEWYTENR